MTIKKYLENAGGWLLIFREDRKENWARISVKDVGLIIKTFRLQVI